ASVGLPLLAGVRDGVQGGDSVGPVDDLDNLPLVDAQAGEHRPDPVPDPLGAVADEDHLAGVSHAEGAEVAFNQPEEIIGIAQGGVIDCEELLVLLAVAADGINDELLRLPPRCGEAMMALLGPPARQASALADSSTVHSDDDPTAPQGALGWRSR